MTDPRPWWTTVPEPELSQEEQALASEAFHGLVRHEIAPLGAFLKSGAPLPRMLRRELVHLIEGGGDLEAKLVIKKARPGGGTPASKLVTGARNFHAAAKVFELTQQAGPDRWPEDAAIKKVADDCGIGEATVKQTFYRLKPRFLSAIQRE
jgi:hypothetical protein